MQFETCQSWIAELVPHFGSSSAIWVVNFSHPLHPDPFCRVKGRGFLCWNGLQSVKCPRYLNLCCVESYILCSPNCHPLLLSNHAHCQSSLFKEHAIDILVNEKGMSECSFRCCMFLLETCYIFGHLRVGWFRSKSRWLVEIQLDSKRWKSSKVTKIEEGLK